MLSAVKSLYYMMGKTREGAEASLGVTDRLCHSWVPALEQLRETLSSFAFGAAEPGVCCSLRRVCSVWSCLEATKEREERRPGTILFQVCLLLPAHKSFVYPVAGAVANFSRSCLLASLVLGLGHRQKAGTEM